MNFVNNDLSLNQQEKLPQ